MFMVMQPKYVVFDCKVGKFRTPVTKFIEELLLDVPWLVTGILYIIVLDDDITPAGPAIPTGPVMPLGPVIPFGPV